MRNARELDRFDLLATRNAAVDSDDPEDEPEPADLLVSASDEPALTSSVSTHRATPVFVGDLAKRMGSTVLAYWTTPDAVYIWVVRADGSVSGAKQKIHESRLSQLVGRAESNNPADRGAPLTIMLNKEADGAQADHQ